MARIKRPCRWLVIVAAVVTGCATTEDGGNVGDDDNDGADDPAQADARPDDDRDGSTPLDVDASPGPADAAIEVVDAGPPADVFISPDAKPFDPLVLDDLEDGNDNIPMVAGRHGFWYTFNDESVGGTQTPAGNAAFKVTAGGPEGSNFCARTTGNGFTLWGAGMGFDLNAGATDNAPKGSIDASAHTGISFMAKGNQPILFIVQTSGVLPTDQGGTCVPSMVAGEECEDAHGKSIALTSVWKEYKVPFTGLAQAGWGKVVAFDKKKLTSVFFQLGASVSFDVWVDDIKLY
jgi:hypothetical protein